MKKWLYERFLPLWAKETVLAENKQLKRRNKALEVKIRDLKCYIKGMRDGKQPLIVEQKQENKELSD